MQTQNVVGAIGPARIAVGSNPTDLAESIAGSKSVSELLGRYSSLTAQGRIFSAYATVTSGVAFSTAAGTGGPLLWNGTGLATGSTGVSAHLLAVLIGGVTTANTVATSVGLTGNIGQSIAPTATTPIDSSGNNLIGGAAAQVTSYRVGTVLQAGNRFMPLAAFGTGATTVTSDGIGWIDVGGAFIIPPSAWGAISFGNTATTGVIQLGAIWAELPY